MIAILLAVGVAGAIKLMSPENTTPVKATLEYPNPFKEEPKKPSTFLGKLMGGKGTPTPTPGTAIDLSQELKATFDDGGQSDLDALGDEAAEL